VPAANKQRVPPQRLDLRQSFLKRAYLNGANLQRALLSNTDITNANLMSAGLTEDSLWGAKLDDAFLRKTSPIKANLSRSDLSDSIGFTWEQISEAVIDETTTLPAAFEERRKAERENANVERES
jgi:uncharacterized protein YjbI with pentapeptide repeats